MKKWGEAKNYIQLFSQEFQYKSKIQDLLKRLVKIIKLKIFRAYITGISDSDIRCSQ